MFYTKKTVQKKKKTVQKVSDDSKYYPYEIAKPKPGQKKSTAKLVITEKVPCTSPCNPD